jgi:ribosome-binding protein aMBF1 (putative translation factor)
MWSEVFEMIKEEQERFYRAIGKALTAARQQRKISIAELSKMSGEQYKTIKCIESGQVCSLHHLVWMTEIFGINFKQIIKQFGGQDGKVKGLSDLI